MDPEENLLDDLIIWVAIRYSPHQGRENFFRYDMRIQKDMGMKIINTEFK
jgi:hypothetical protein